MKQKPAARWRFSWPFWISYPYLIVTYAFWPVIRLLDLIRVWGWLLSKILKLLRQGRFGRRQPTDGDVLVCSGFKSGTNWTLQIAVQIAHRGSADFGHIHDVVPWPEFPLRALYAVSMKDPRPKEHSPTGLRVIKTHLPMGKVPYVPSARYICVVRDPKDVLVSSFFFLGSLMGPFMPSRKTWIRQATSPDVIKGGWGDHLDSYWRIRERDNVLFLTYEEMKRDLSGAISRIAEFMGVELSPSEHAAVLERSGFDYMKSVEHKFDPTGLVPRWSTRGIMIRRGQSGSSGELLSAADRQRVDDFWREELRRKGSDFPYDDVFSVTN